MAEGTAKAANLVVDALGKEGVKYVFSVSGSSILPLYDALIDTPIEVIHTRHEWGASFMAEGWGRITGDPGVCLVTLGPGSINCANAAMTALLDATPMVIIGGRSPTRVWDRDGFGDFDTAALMRTATKFSRTITDPNRAGEYIHLAFQHARSGRPGPVYLELPNDVLEATIAGEPRRSEPLPVHRPAGAPPDVEAAARLLRDAERPIAIVGSGARMAGVGDELRSFAERLGVPVFGVRLGRGLIARDHPLYLGVGIVGTNPVLRHALRAADAVLILGARLDFDLEFGASDYYNPKLKAVQVDIDPTAIGRPKPVDAGIVGDARLVLDQLNAALPDAAERRRGWTNMLSQERQEFVAQRDAEGDEKRPVHPARIVEEVSKAARPDAIFTISGGEIWSWGRNYLEASPPGAVVDIHRSGTLGGEIPHAIAAKLARPDAQVVAITGDGGFGYSGVELETAARYGIAVTCVLANDSVWAMEKWSQIYAYGEERVYATNLGQVNYQQIGTGLNVQSERVEDAAELPGAIRRALDSGKASLVEVVSRDLPGPDTRWWFLESGQGSPG